MRLYSASFSPSFSSDMASISMARRAAFLAPSIPTVATGTPVGIWTMLRRASMPPSLTSLGTPITGLMVCAATAPGRAAARPAMQMKTCASVDSTYAESAFGFCVLTESSALLVPNSFRIVWLAASLSSLSESLPMIMEILQTGLGCRWSAYESSPRGAGVISGDRASIVSLFTTSTQTSPSS